MRATGTRKVLAQAINAAAAVATSPAMVVAWCIIFLGSAATYLVTSFGPGYLESHVKSQYDWTIRTAILLSGVVMLTLVMWGHQTRNRKVHRAGPAALSCENPPDSSVADDLVTDWRYAVRPVLQKDLAALMDRGSQGLDRRRDERFQLGNVRGTLTALGTELPEQECILVDVSASGGRVLTRSPLDIGALVKLATQDILLIGEVRHCESADGLQVIGVKFEARIDRSNLRLMTRGFEPAERAARG